MNLRQVMAIYGGLGKNNFAEVGRNLGFSRQRVRNWVQRIPRDAQELIELRTGGVLKADKRRCA